MRFNIDWACNIVGSKLTVFASFNIVFEGNFPSTSPWGAYIWRGDLTEGFLRSGLRGLYLEGLIFGILRYLICLTGPPPKLIGNITFYSLKLIRLLRVVFSSEQRLNRPAVNAGFDNVAGKSGADELNKLLIINAEAISISIPGIYLYIALLPWAIYK